MLFRSIESIKEHILFFLENHDEQRIASDFFAGNAQAGIPGITYMATHGTNPVMIYNGQELGENGMDEEGFSGKDGRTSIFDYWSMDSVRKWANNGSFDGKFLNKEQRELREYYKKILNLAKEEKALSLGSFYGLAYCNKDNPHFPSEHIKAYLRKHEDELIVILINFDKKEHSFRANIPRSAFEMLHIPDNKASIAKELLSEEESVCSLTHACPFEGIIPSLSSKILKFNYKNSI